MEVAAFLAAAVAVALIGAIVIGTLSWNRTTASMVQRLDERNGAAAPPGSPPFSRDELEGLPGPVVRYFQFALTPGQQRVRRARFSQKGEFAMRAGEWKAFTASEYFSVSPPAFVWDANIRMIPLLPVHVRDGYIGGEGVMYGKLAALVLVVNQRGTPEMASGELLRYLAETVWLPTALLPSAGVSWSPVSDTVAIATLTDGRTTAALNVHFGGHGEIVRIEAMRYRDVDGAPVLTPWVGHFSDYQRANGMMIPMSGDVEWVLPQGPSPYWRGRIISADYEFAQHGKSGGVR